MKKSKLFTSLILVAMTAPGVALAGDGLPITANASLTTDYLFRGISQTGHDPAIQGGFDFAHDSGFYVGVWGSNVGWIEDYQGYDSGNLEIDLYGGVRGGIGGSDFTYDLGLIQYYYPGDRPVAITNADTTEVYAALGYKWVTAKYLRTVSSGSFGFADAGGSNYLDISANVPLGETGLTAGMHLGSFNFKNNGAQDYDDWKISLSYDLGSGMSAGVAYSDTNADDAVWTDANGEKLGDGKGFVWVSKAL